MTRAGSKGRIVHVTTTDMSLALLLGPQLEAFASAGFEVIGASAPGGYAAQLEAAGIRHVPLRHATRAMAPHRDLLAIGELAALFRRLRPDVVHTHNPKPGVYGRLAAKAARVPVIVNTVHGLYAVPEDRLRRRALVYGLERVAAACSDAELVQNPEDLEVLARLGIPRSKLHLLGNGVDLRRFDPATVPAGAAAALREQLGVKPGEVVVGVVGRLVWEKGYREVFAAAGLLRASLPQARFVVVGPADPDKADAVDAASLRAAEDAGVVFTGSRSDMVELYAAFDLYLLGSYREGFPRSAMEAAAMGLPVVATDIRGCRQVVEAGRTGLLVAPRDPAAMADAVGRLAGDEELRRRMGAAARQKAVEDFDDRDVIAITLSVYERLLGRPR